LSRFVRFDVQDLHNDDDWFGCLTFLPVFSHYTYQAWLCTTTVHTHPACTVYVSCLCPCKYTRAH
jgi:hypothetical protein